MTSTHSGTRSVQARYRLLDVRAVERITPRMVRVTLGGEELADFTDKGTDQRIKLCLPEPGRPAPLGRTRAEVFALPREQQPRQRTYTVRHVDAHRRELMVDLVLHDHIGPGASWAANVRPGDRIVTVGPSPSYQPSPEANPLVLAGDETALPAISAIVEQLPRATPVRVFVEIADGEEQQEIATVADVEWTWLHRDGIPAGRSSLLTEAVRTAELGTHPHVWIGAESDTVRELRAHFQDVLGWQRRRVYALAYWRRDRAER